MSMTAKGHNARLSFDGETVVIERRGLLSRITGKPARKLIPLTSITAVRWREPGHILNGYIAFTIPGGDERPELQHAANDENTVIFTHPQRVRMESLRSVIEQGVRNQR